MLTRLRPGRNRDFGGRARPFDPPRQAQAWVAIAGLVLLELLFEAMHRLGDLKLYVVETIALGLAAGFVYLLVLYGLEHTAERRAVFWLILAGAVLYRLTLFPLELALSDDLYRYRWDGRIQAAAAANPYAVRPDDPRLKPLREADWQKIPGRDIPTLYPPLTELIYRATYPALRNPVAFKLPFVLADLLVGALLAGWVRTTGGRNYHLAIYAWNPLVVVEFAASGHNDSLALAALFGASLTIIKGRRTMSTLLLTAAALSKVFPAVLFPLWLRRSGWPRSALGWGNALCAVALAGLCAWPFFSAWPQVLDSLAYYQSRWQHNNASLYTLLSWATGSTDLALGLGLGVVAGLALWLAAGAPARRSPGPHAGEAGSDRDVGRDALRAAYILFGAILMLSPNTFAWYFTWMVPLLCFFPNPAWLLLTVLQFLSNHVLIDYQASGLWRFRPEMLWLTYGPFYALLLWQAVRGLPRCSGGRSIWNSPAASAYTNAQPRP